MNAGESREIAFFGKITAGITHEMKNVLAIIKESSGLMEDILSMARETPIPHEGKLQKVLTSIQDQVHRGVELTLRLNKFAHSPDHSTATIDLNELVQQMIDLSQRFARLKNIVLKAYSADQPLTIITRPVQLQMALFTCIECCLNRMPAGGQIHVRPQKRGEQFVIHIFCKGELPGTTAFARDVSTSGEWPEVQETLASLAGTAELDESAPGITLSLPENFSSI